MQTRPWLRAAFQALFLVLLALATWILITGPGQGAAPRSAFEFRHLVLLAAVVSAAVRLWTSIPVGGRGRWSDLGAAAGLFGYCIGASPIIYMNWVLSEPVFVGSELVTSVSRILRQFSAIVHTGLPILLGWYHNWAQPVRTVPVLLRATVVAVAVASLVWLLLSALNARRRDLPSGPPLAFLVLLFAIQVIAFSASKSGRLASEPRYLVTLYWIVCLSAGLLADRIWRASRPLKPGAVALVGVVVVANMWSCVDAPRQKIVRWSGEEQSLRTLIDDLESHGLNRVSGRFCRYGYLCSYMISYVSDERVLAAPAGDPNGTNIRSERYQREVDEAPELAYFVMDADLPFIEDYLRRCMVDYEVLRSDNFRTIHDVYPDVLHGIGANDIPGLVEAAR